MKEWEKKLYRYRLRPAPEKKPLQEYIELYLDTGDESLLAAFLHYYEPRLNDLSMGYVQEYAMQGHFADIKSACVFGVPYARYEIKRAVDDYIRTMRTGFTVPTDTEYYLLRTAMRLYAEHDYKTDDETANLIAEKIKRKPEYVREMLRCGLQNMQFTDFYHTYEDEDGDEETEDITCDRSSEPGAMFFRDEQAADLYEAFQYLEYRERDMLSRHLGFCPECFSTVDKDGKPLEKWTYTDLMLQYGLSSPDTVEKACKKALEKMRTNIQIVL